MNRFELLAPAGSSESLKAAINAGADAVYIGGNLFGARAYADNPETDELIRDIEFCHLRGKKVYLTVNTLFKENELNELLYDYLKPFYEAGVDAVIVQDIGAMSFIQKHFPELPIHISTQASVTMAEGANCLKERFNSITRVVPARELSLNELKRFRQDCNLEMEVFIHGALCYSCSGQCLLSSMIGGRSGNRGRCAQPCRKLYDGKYLLSPKDQCILPVLHELMDIGIESFKIEGRMKSPEYTAGVVSVYRKYIDLYEKLGSKNYCEWLTNHKKELDKDINRLKELYNRGGFNEGYLHKHNSPEMMTFDRPNHSGVKVGEVIAVRGREAVIRFSEQVYAQDVIEIRRVKENTLQKDKVFEFTLGNGFDKNETFSCITMKDSRAETGQKVYRTRCNELLSEIETAFIQRDIKVPVKCRYKAFKGQTMSLEYECEGIKACEYGTVTETAQKVPSDKAGILKQLLKLGETDFCCSPEDSDIEIDDGIFAASGELNRLRRTAIESLKEKILDKYRRKTVINSNETIVECPESDKAESVIPCSKEESLYESEKSDIIAEPEKGFEITYSIWTEEQLRAVCQNEGEYEICCNLYQLNPDTIRTYIEIAGKHKLILGLPYICRADIYKKLNVFIRQIHSTNPEIEFMVRNREEEILAANEGCKYRTDYNVYMMNSSALDERSNCLYTLPQELNKDELLSVARPESEMIVYGYQPVMFSAQCVYKNKFGRCRDIKSADFVTITDELGHDFRCRQLCEFCTNIIYNSAKLSLTDYIEDIRKMGVKRIRYDFTFENPEEIASVIRSERCTDHEHYTSGHFQRGVL